MLYKLYEEAEINIARLEMGIAFNKRALIAHPELLKQINESEKQQIQMLAFNEQMLEFIKSKIVDEQNKQEKENVR